MALVLSLMAVGGFALAALLPSASAATSCGPYSEYTQYCETTTSTTTSTTTTSTTTTTGTTPTTTTTGSTSPAVIAPGTLITNSSTLAVGTKLASGVKVISNKGGVVVIDDNGTDITVPKGSQLVVLSDGTALVTTTKNGVTTSKLYLRKGVKIIKAKVHINRLHVVFLHYTQGTLFKYLKFSGASPKVTKVSGPRGTVWITLKKAVSATTISFSSKDLKFLGSEGSYIKTHHIKTLTYGVALTTTTGKTKIFTVVIPV